MDHDRAAESQAVERYLLGEMPADERENFEEHYFTCAECAKDVRAAARFRANAREALREPEPFERPEKERRATWWSWPTLVPLAASILLSGVVVYQNTAITALRAPQSLDSPLILDGRTRGSLPHLDEGQPVNLIMALDPSAAGRKVIAELDWGSSKSISRPLATPARDEPFRVYFPGGFRPGRYTIVVRDATTGQEVARNEFEIAQKESNANAR